MRNILILLLAGGLLLTAADHKKHFVVCLHSGADQSCTVPLEKDVATAVAEVFAKAPIGGLDYVSITDINKTKGKPIKPPKVEAPPVSAPVDHVLYEYNI